MAFSVFYYGFFLPNTKYAKLDAGIDASQLIENGMNYVSNYFQYDPFSAFYVSGFVLVALGVMALRRAAELKLAMVVAGLVFYVLYLIAIGGDYMAGRFFYGPLVMAVMWGFIMGRGLSFKGLAAAFVIIVAAASVGYESLPFMPERGSRYPGHIEDVRQHQLKWSGMFNSPDEWVRSFPGHGLVNIRPARVMQTTAGLTLEVNKFYSGIHAFYTGSDLIVIDAWALTDPLLARLPANKGRKPGHFLRAIPFGYAEARATDDLTQLPVPIANYYEKLRLVTNGSLLDPQRLLTIIGFQLGLYDHWLDEYVAIAGL
jgi:arabinofuranosyltransferase